MPKTMPSGSQIGNKIILISGFVSESEEKIFQRRKSSNLLIRITSQMAPTTTKMVKQIIKSP